MKLSFSEWLKTITPFQQEALGFYTLKSIYLSECYDEHVKQLEEDHKQSVKHADKLIEENRNLEAQLFNSETHYEILKENYDLVFKWVAEMKGCSEEIAFDSFKGWLSK